MFRASELILWHRHTHIFLKYRSEAHSLEGEQRCNTKRSKRWPMLFQRVKNAHLVSETT
uniref:Uncharacterized protein n=1 Tax=Cucumis melo TaxID=3656 RepID=A0A9I9E519_CUCME